MIQAWLDLPPPRVAQGRGHQSRWEGVQKIYGEIFMQTHIFAFALTAFLRILGQSPITERFEITLKSILYLIKHVQLDATIIGSILIGKS